MSKRLFINGKIYPGNSQPETEAIAVNKGSIVCTGKTRDLMDQFHGYQIFDLQNLRVLPGFIDSHTHFLAYCLKQKQIDLDGLSLEKCIEKIKLKVNESKPGEWILGQGWNKNFWANSEFPDRFILDKYTPDNPVCLESRDYHSSWINTKALNIIQHQLNLQNNDLVLKDIHGVISGVFFESAREIIWNYLPSPDKSQKKNALQNGLCLAYKNGLSGVHSFESLDDYFLLKELSAENYPLRITCYLPYRDLNYIISNPHIISYTNDFFQFGGIKFFMDGALGSQTALMFDPYENNHNNHGELCINPDFLEEQIRLANQNGIPCAVHAIGDKANNILINIFSKFGNNGIRNRIEHAQLVSDDDFEIFMDFVVAMQPIHIREDIDSAEKYWGKRSKNAFAFKKLLKIGARLAFGSDAPVETPNVFEGIYTALTRTSRKNNISWYPDQCLTLTEIIHAYTMGSAYAASCENRLGSIEPGKKADFMVLSDDIFSCNTEYIPETNVQLMIINGNIEYTKP